MGRTGDMLFLLKLAGAFLGLLGSAFIVLIVLCLFPEGDTPSTKNNDKKH
jgi:hypothetical protein